MNQDPPSEPTTASARSAADPIQPRLDLDVEIADPVTGSVVVRPDLNLEKWPLWEASNSRHLTRARTLQREIHLPDGSIVTARVEVGFSNHGTLTTEDQKTCYGLFKLWEDAGKPTGPIHFSRQQLARALKKTWGSKVNKAITDSLLRLRFTPFVWEHSYFDSGTQETLERVDTFNILSELHLTRKTRTEGGRTRETGGAAERSHFTFNDRILANLMAGFTRPVYLDTILTFQSEIAQILYTYLDLVMADKTRFERRTRELFEDLGIDGTTYRYPSKRAQVLEPALRELESVPVPTGALQCTLERTADGTDYKIVVTKTRRAVGARRRKLAAPEPPALPPPVVTRVVNAPPDPARSRSRNARPPKSPENPPKSARMDQESILTPEGPLRGADEATEALASAASSASEGQSLADAAVQQVRYFYQRFFQSGDTARPTARERQVALDHVRRLGVEKAEYLVLFALRESRKTGFEIQSYGGIAQYEARALAEMEANAQQRQRALEQRGRESHQRRFLGDYHAYLRQRLTELEADPTEDFNLFQEEERRLRQRLDGGAGRIAERFGGEETRLERFRAFLKGRMDQGARVEGVLTFWEWDTQRNPEGLEKA